MVSADDFKNAGKENLKKSLNAIELSLKKALKSYNGERFVLIDCPIDVTDSKLIYIKSKYNSFSDITIEDIPSLDRDGDRTSSKKLKFVIPFNNES